VQSTVRVDYQNRGRILHPEIPTRKQGTLAIALREANRGQRFRNPAHDEAQHIAEAPILLFNIEVNLRCGAVFRYLVVVSSISNSATRAHFRPRTVFAASATAFSAAFAKLSLEVPTTSITFCVIRFSFDLLLWIVPLVCTVIGPLPHSLVWPKRNTKLRLPSGRGVPLGMSRIHPAEWGNTVPPGQSVAANVLLRQEPDEGEDKEEDDGDGKEDEDEDEGDTHDDGYSE